MGPLDCCWRTSGYSTVNSKKFGIRHTCVGAMSKASWLFKLEEAIGLPEIPSLFSWTLKGS